MLGDESYRQDDVLNLLDKLDLHDVFLLVTYWLSLEYDIPCGEIRPSPPHKGMSWVCYKTLYDGEALIIEYSFIAITSRSI